MLSVGMNTGLASASESNQQTVAKNGASVDIAEKAAAWVMSEAIPEGDG